MRREPFGTYIETTTLGETVRAFLPPTLPPDPPLAFTAGSQSVLDRAMSLPRAARRRCGDHA